MLRLRLAMFAVASGLLFTMSGCCSFCEDGKLFPRLFPHRAMSSKQGDCDCHHANAPHMMEGAAHGPILITPGAAGPTMPIPTITTVPAHQAPQVFKVPSAQATPYNPVP